MGRVVRKQPLRQRDPSARRGRMVRLKTEDSGRGFPVLESDLITTSKKAASQLPSMPADEMHTVDFLVESEDWETISIYAHWVTFGTINTAFSDVAEDTEDYIIFLFELSLFGERDEMNDTECRHAVYGHLWDCVESGKTPAIGLKTILWAQQNGSSLLKEWLCEYIKRTTPIDEQDNWLEGISREDRRLLIAFLQGRDEDMPPEWTPAYSFAKLTQNKFKLAE